MWQAKQTEGFVELEQDYARLLKCDDGTKWSSITITPDGDIWTSLKKAIPEFFAPKVILNFVCIANGSTSVLEFPVNTTDKDIEANLQINRRNFFNEPEELFFKLTKGNVNQITQKREITASYVKVSTIENIKSLCEAASVKLGKITTLPDSLFGAIKRQFPNLGQDVNLCIQIGFSKVYVIIFKGSAILSVRTLITGSLRELEAVLFASYSLTRSDVRLMISGRHQQPIPVIQETIKENRLELITHLGGIFAELRTKKLLTPNSQIYLSYNIIDEPQLTSMIADRFDIQVNVITGMEEDETGKQYEDYPAAWLVGACDSSVPNLIPAKKISLSSLIFNPTVSIIVALLITAIPYPVLYQHKKAINSELDELRKKNVPVEAIINEFKEVAEQQKKLTDLASQINTDIESRGISSRIIRHITEKLPESTRIENIEVDYKTGIVNTVGYTVDTESALRYLDNIKSCEEITNPEILISDLESRRIKFSIRAFINNGKGRK